MSEIPPDQKFCLKSLQEENTDDNEGRILYMASVLAMAHKTLFLNLKNISQSSIEKQPKHKK